MKIGRSFLGQTLFNKLMKATIYGQFVGGENIAELKSVISRLKASGVHPILDYAVEEDVPEKEVVMETRQVVWYACTSGSCIFDTESTCNYDWPGSSE